MDAFNTPGLSSLRSKEQLNILDEIDALSRSGIGEHVSLPQIAVCGDQSSGKSSCLEAISGVPFPRKDTLCTRFATELVLRKNPEEFAVVNIVPDSKRSEKDRQKLSEFQRTILRFDDLPGLIEAAKVAMGLDANGSGFSADILRIEVSGPKRPHLTVVDLPGLIHAKNDDQEDENTEEVVSELVDSYMRRPRTVILAVVSAMSDRALQAILKRAKAVDPDGIRTMGLITKPDTLPPGSDSENDFVKLAKNEITKFRLGWHVLRNRDYDMRNSSDAERDRKEEDFFSYGVWSELPRGLLGISTLRERLSNILLDHIKSELPALMDEIQKILDDCSEALAKLGDNRGSLGKQRLYLLKHSQSFTTICRASCDGLYEDEFFGDPLDRSARTRRFRAVVQNLNSAYAEDIRLHGHDINIVGSGQEGKNEKAISWARELLTNSRGRELPGTFSPMLIGDLFKAQSKPWEQISDAHLKNVWIKAKRHIKVILSSLTDEDTCTALLLHWIDPAMDNSLKNARKRMESLFADRKRHAITYNHYFTKNIQGSFNARIEKRMREVLEGYFPIEGGGYNARRIGPKDLTGVCSMMSRTVADMDTYASIELLDHLEAFYKVFHEPQTNHICPH